MPFRPFARGFAALACAAGFLESAPGGAPAYLQRLAHAVENDALVLFRCLRVFILEPEGYLPFGGHADPVFHGTSQAGGMGFALTPGEAPLHFSRSKNVMHVADHIFFDVANRLDDIDVSPR
ncbi:integrase [Bifidobacterium longum]|nr:integrase [Bifidobacterium longum]KAB7427729.1 integrase [Bifidobacterium longum]KAB7438686.1 integrase [Bifidobacterium longum]